MAKPNALDAIIAAQKEKNPNSNVAKSSIEEALFGVDTMSAADFKRLLAGETIQTATAAPASNIIEIAQDIKKLTENSESQVAGEVKTLEIIENTNDNIQQIVSGIENLNDTQEDIALTPEEKTEEIDLIHDEIDVLKQIEENTRKESIVPKSLYGTGDNNGSSLGAGLMGFLGGGLAGGIGGLFAGLGTGAAESGIIAAITGGLTKFIRRLFVGLLKGAVIFTVIGSIANGLIDGIEEYKKSGDLKEAIWAGLAGVLEFISLGLIDKEILDNLRDYVSEQWKSFAKSIMEFIDSITKSIMEFIDSIEKIIMEFIDSITPDFLKDKIVKTEHGQSETKGVFGRMFADTSDTLSTIDYDNSGISIKAEERRGELFGANEYVVNYNGEELKVNKDIYAIVKLYLDNGSPEKAAYTLDVHREKTEALTNAAPKMTMKEINQHVNNIDPNTGTSIISVPEKTTADNVIKQSESNNALKDDIMSNPAPVIINAPTTNTSMQHTTALPNIKARDDSPKLFDTYGNAGAIW